MELVFRKLSAAESATPQPGEVHLVPAAAEQRQRRDLARFVLEQGTDGLLRGPGTPERLVLDTDPKFDDMLAALFVQRQAQGQPLPKGCRAFADYAARLREGKRPSNFPLQASLEGIFLAMRGNAEKSLADAEAGQRFLADWGRLVDVVLKAAEQDHDPATTAIFSGALWGRTTPANPLPTLNWGQPLTVTRAGFLREHAFLAKDLEVYRRDFERGERWRVRLRGTAGKVEGTGLLLRQPKSLLFKYWTRSPCDPPLDGPYSFLAVAMSDGYWVFTTDPVHKVSLKPLAELLQAAERKKAPARAEVHPWSDGKGDGTLVSSPSGGTQLDERIVLGIVKKWCRARSLHRFGWLARTAILAAGCLLVAAVLWWNRSGGDSPPPPPGDPYPRAAPAVVVVEIRPGDRGTGFLISADGWLITNKHVIDTARPDIRTGAKQATVYLGKMVDGSMRKLDEGIPALVYKEDAIRDLALLKLTRVPPGQPFLTRARSGGDIAPGKDCLAIGAWSRNRGQVSKVFSLNDRREDFEVDDLVRDLAAKDKEQAARLLQLLAESKRRVILSDCSLFPGDSGGPLLNAAGEVIGVSFALPKTDGSVLAKSTLHIHLDELNAFLGDWPAEPTEPARPFRQPPGMPDDWPKQLDVSLVLRPAAGYHDAVIFKGNKVDLAWWVDLKKSNEPLDLVGLSELQKKDRVSQAKWQYQFALHLADPSASYWGPTAYYATGGSRINHIVQAPALDAKPDIKWRLHGEKWIAEEVSEFQSLISAAWFADADLRRDFAPYEKLFRKQLKLGGD